MPTAASSIKGWHPFIHLCCCDQCYTHLPALLLTHCCFKCGAFSQRFYYYSMWYHNVYKGVRFITWIEWKQFISKLSEEQWGDIQPFIIRWRCEVGHVPASSGGFYPANYKSLTSLWGKKKTLKLSVFCISGSGVCVQHVALHMKQLLPAFSYRLDVKVLFPGEIKDCPVCDHQ